MTLPVEPEPSPLDLALRHLAHVTGLAVQAEGVADAASNEARRAQLAHLELARTFAVVAQAEALTRIADAFDRDRQHSIDREQDLDRDLDDHDIQMRGSYGPGCPHGVRLHERCAACDAEGRYDT